MLAFSKSRDQTRPTIVLHGEELAICPAGLDPHGNWGIQVDPPVDGRAQELRNQLEVAAKRMSGGAGKPPRLQDEEPLFEKQRTNFWMPLPSVQSTNESASESPQPCSEYFGAPPPGAGEAQIRAPQPPIPSTPNGTPPAQGNITAFGLAPAPRLNRQARGKAKQENLSQVVGHTMPLGFRLDDMERKVCNALDQSEGLLSWQIAEIVGTSDGSAWMQAMIERLRQHGIDLIDISRGNDGPLYRLRR